MKLCLVYAPQSIPTSAPAGIAHLKSFIESCSQSKVRNIDLNPFFYDNAIKNLAEGKLVLHNKKERNEKSIALIKKAVEIFKGKNKDDFFKADIYNPCANEFLYLFDSLYKRNNSLLFQYVNSQNNLVSDFLMPFTKRVQKEKPDMVGFSILSAEQTYFSLALAKKLKQELNIPIIIGGGAARLYPERYLNHNFVDYIIKGDGEIPLLNLLENKNSKDILNLVYRKDNKVIANKEMAMQNLDKLPFPDFSDFDLESYFCPEKVLTILTSRGCYWRKCAFCSDCDSISMQYRVKSTARILEEINHLKNKYSTKFFFFADEMIAPARFKQISESLINKNTNISYYAQAKPVKELGKELLTNMHKSGCRILMFGVESGCQRILDLMEKGTNVNDVEEVLKNSHDAGIKNAVFAFGGFPTEKEKEYEQTISFLQKNKPNIDIQFTGYFRLAKNSKIIKNPAKYSITGANEDKESDSLMPTYHYNVKEGVTEKRTEELFKENYTFFLELNKFSPFLGKFRDHMLVYYSTNN